jgi:hypothetical protein
MRGTSYGGLFRLAQIIGRIILPKFKVQLPERVDGPVVYVSHHQNMFGPITIMVWFPSVLRTWVFNVFFDQKACFKQYTRFTFTKRFGLPKFLAKCLAFPISYFIPAFFRSMRSIPVYRGSREIMKTFQMSAEALKRGESVVIFPDVDYSDASPDTKEMYDGFLHVEKHYYRATGKHVNFVPLYASRRSRIITAEKPIQFRDGEDFHTQRRNVLQQIQDSLNRLARKCGDL